MGSKMGRPTDNPKTETVHVRLDNECVEILSDYCKEKQVSRTEAIRQGIKKLRSDINK